MLFITYLFAVAMCWLDTRLGRKAEEPSDIVERTLHAILIDTLRFGKCEELRLSSADYFKLQLELKKRCVFLPQQVEAHRTWFDFWGTKIVRR